MHLHKKPYVGLMALAVLGLIVRSTGLENIVVALVHAEDPAKDILTQTSTLIGYFTAFMEFVAFAVFQFIQFFLDPTFILDLTSEDGHGKALNSIWQFSRNVMNVIFAFMLVGAGIFTVVTANKDLVMNKYKKFIIAVILVNFSWFFPRVILDVANVLAATIYQLPSTLRIDDVTTSCLHYPNGRYRLDGNGNVLGNNPPSNCDMITDVKFSRDPCDGAAGYKETSFGLCVKYETMTDDNLSTPYGIINGLVVNYGNLPNLTRVLKARAEPAPPGVGGLLENKEKLKEYFFFLVHIAFVLLLMMMLFFPLVAMFIVFLIRIPIIWLTIAFMPFMFLGFVADDKLTPGFNSFNIFQHYIKAAFLPAAVAVPLTVGYVLINTVTSVPCPVGGAAAILCDPSDAIIYSVQTPIDLLWLLMSFLVMWVGFFSALKIDDIYVQATASLKGIGEGFGKTALKLPLTIPVIPSGKNADGTTKYGTILGIDDRARAISSAISGGQTLPQAFSDDSAKTIVDAMNNQQSPTNTALADIAREVKRTHGENATEAQITAIIQNHLSANAPNDKLKEGLQADGLDPSKVTAAEIFRNLNQSQNEQVRTLARNAANQGGNRQDGNQQQQQNNAQT